MRFVFGSLRSYYYTSSNQDNLSYFMLSYVILLSHGLFMSHVIRQTPLLFLCLVIMKSNDNIFLSNAPIIFNGNWKFMLSDKIYTCKYQYLSVNNCIGLFLFELVYFTFLFLSNAPIIVLVSISFFFFHFFLFSLTL